MSTRALSATRLRASVLVGLALIVLFANFIALSARLAIPLPFSPVDVTGETLAVLLAGLALGPRRGMASVLVFIGEGAVGLPVFQGGTGGPAMLIGPTGGYLWGFVLAAGLVGVLAERGATRRTWTLLLALVLGNLVIYLVGAGWLSRLLPGGVPSAVTAGIIPFLPGDAVKCLVAAGMLPSAARFVDRLLGQNISAS
jgi:biotin transport system substrate-specific component